MTTTAYDTAAILRQNVADLERELQRQRERAETALCYSPFPAKKVARLRDKVEVKKREAEGIQVKIEMK